MKAALAGVDGQNHKIQQTQPKTWYPISEAQRNILNTWKFDTDSTAYNIPFTLSINSKISTEDIEKALYQLYKRHTIVDARIDSTNETFQIAENQLSKLNVSQCKFGEEETYLRSFIKPFHLENDRLYRQELLEVDSNTKILFLDFHHIIADGESIKLFVSELSKLLSNEALPLNTIDFKDYIEWRHSSINKEKESKQEKYWKDKFNTEIPVLELPTDFLRKAVKQHKGARKRWKLTEELSSQLRTIAKKNQTTLHSVMFTAYSWLLHKISNKESISVGLPISEKMHSDLHAIFGMFVNSLPVISKVENDITFSESIASNRKEIIEAVKNQHYPVQKLNGLMGSRDASRNNLFDTMFLFQEEIENQSSLVKPFHFDPGFSKYDLSLEVFNEAAIVVDIEYATDLFTSNTIENLQRYFNTILEQVSHEETIKYSELSLLNRKDTNMLIYQFNETTETLEHDNFLSMYNNHVQNQPNSTAVVHGEEIMSYAKLNLTSNVYANSLKEKGVKKGDTICVMLEKSTDLIGCILAIFKLGAVYIPIETDTPHERVEYIAENAECNVFIHDGDFKNDSITSKLFVTLKDLEGSSSEFNQELIASEDPAYIIYTSGTTGQPKGVVVSHKSLANYLQWGKEYYIEGNLNQTMALYSNISFDLTLTSVFLPLCSGNTVKIFSMNIKNMDIEKLFSDKQVNIIKLTPSHLKVLLNNQVKIAKDTNLKSLIVGGENLEQELAHSIYKMFDGKIKILNEYGPTEATIGCMIYAFDFDDIDTSVPIGKPIKNTYIYVLDKKLKPVPNGVDGDLYISGDGLAKGYWRNETLTNEKFIDNPFVKGERMYDTGDIARRNYNNDLVFVGRRDNQVKINGFRIEVEEIEALFRKHDAITDCIVLPKTTSKRTFLTAFIVEESMTDKKASIIDLKNYLAENVPYYMIPERIIGVHEIPLTNNGKADLKELNTILERNLEVQKSETNLEETEVLHILREVWKEVLKLDTISDEDSFYEIGGDSIKAAQIVSKLQEREVLLSIKEILTYNTLAQISAFLETESYRKELKIFEGSLEGDREITPIEWWFLKQQFENSGFYNQSVFLKFNKTVDKGVLEQAFEILIEYHDNLRINVAPNTVFYNNDHIKSKVSIEEYQLTDASQETLNKILTTIKDGFNLSSSLLIKAAMLKVPNEDSDGLLITAHHILVDGISWRILLEDLYSIYNSLINQKDINIPHKSASIKRWLEKSKSSYNEGALNKEIDFWKSTWTDAFLFPEKFHNQDKQALRANYYSGEIQEKLNALFIETTRDKNAFNVDKQIILFLSWALAIKQVASNDNIAFQVESNGRNGLDIDISRTIGWFTTFYPLKFNLAGKDLATSLLEVKEAMRKIPNQGLGYMLLNQKGLIKDSSFMFPEVRFNYLGEFGEEMNNDLFALWSLENGLESSKENKVTAKIEINIIIVNNQINYKIIYSQLIESSIINDLLIDFENQLREILMLIQNAEEIHYSPSDFSSATLDVDDLNNLFG
nr:hypothetical protein BACY1_00600 [Tenacibaculum mesophilum]